MKTLLVVSFILICIDITVYSQNSGNWKVQFNTGIEQHDKRLFDYSEKETGSIIKSVDLKMKASHTYSKSYL